MYQVKRFLKRTEIKFRLFLNRNSAIEIPVAEEMLLLEAEAALKAINRQMKRGKQVYIEIPKHISSTLAIAAYKYYFAGMRPKVVYVFSTRHEDLVFTYTIDRTPMDSFRRSKMAYYPMFASQNRELIFEHYAAIKERTCKRSEWLQPPYPPQYFHESK